MSQKIKKILNRINRRDLKVFPKLSKYFKPLLILLVMVSVVFVGKSVLAINTNEFKEKQNAMDKGNNQESWMKESIGSNAMVGINILAGKIPDEVLDGDETAWNPGGLIGLTNQGIAIAYSIPVSGVEYIAQLKNNFLGKPVYADTGFQQMSPLIPLWKGFRNVTYVLFSLIFVGIGLMIMLRIKINPQTVINIQNSIPKMITALVLVTFSYAIVGLLIDLTYVITGLLLSLVFKASGDTSSISEIVRTPHLLGKVFKITNPIWIMGTISLIIGSIVAAFGPAAWLVGGVAVIVLGFVGFLIIFINVFKFFIGLIKCYITILIKTIIAPLEIALGAIPNMKMGFNTWILSIVANIMVFPISLIFLVLVRKIMDAVKSSNQIWTPPGLTWLDGGNVIATVIGIGAFLMLSKLPKLIPEFIFQIKPSPFGDAVGESVSNISKGPIGSFVKQGALEAGAQKARNRYGDGSGQGKFGKFMAGAVDTLETTGKVKEKRPQ